MTLPFYVDKILTKEIPEYSDSVLISLDNKFFRAVFGAEWWRITMKDKEMNDFKKMLLEKRAKLLGNVDFMHGEALKKSRQSACGDLSNVPIHMADIGTDNYDRDLTIDLIQNGEEEVRNIDIALEKIEEGTFGVCEVCQKKINKPRLIALPHARLCIECQRVEEVGGGTV